MVLSIVHFVSRILFMEPLWWLCYTPFRFEVCLCVFFMSITYLFYLDRISIKITHHHCWRMRISGCVTRGKWPNKQNTPHKGIESITQSLGFLLNVGRLVQVNIKESILQGKTAKLVLRLFFQIVERKNLKFYFYLGY